MMSRNLSRRLVLLVFIALGLLTPPNLHATAIAFSEIFFSNLQIIHPAGTDLVFLNTWTAEAFAAATNSTSQFNSSVGGVAKADAGKIAETFAEGHGFASALDITASAESDGNIPGTTTALALSKGIGDLFSSFMIVGGVGLVDVSFSVDITGSLDVFTDAFGLAEADTIFALEVDGSPVLFDFKLLSVGPSSSDSLAFSESLFGTITLSFDTTSFLFVSLDSEVTVTNKVSEPSTLALMLAGLWPSCALS
jgi:hypothetical protein